MSTPTESATEPTKENTPEKMKDAGARSLSKTFWILIAIIFLGAGISYNYLTYRQQVSGYFMMETKDRVLRTQTRELLAHVLQLQGEQQNMRKDIAQLRQQNQQNSGVAYHQAAALAAIEQLVVAADVALRTENDGYRAQVLLSGAIDYASSNVPGYSVIKEALERDKAAIKEMSIVDREAVALRLHALMQQLGVLQQEFNFVLPAQAKPAAAASLSSVAPSNAGQMLRDAVRNAACVLRNLVVISHRDNSPRALTAAEMVNLKLNMQALLLEAVWAVNHHQSQVYKQALQDTHDLLATYFPGNTNVKNTMLPALQKLQQVDVALKPCSIDKTLKVLSQRP